MATAFNRNAPGYLCQIATPDQAGRTAVADTIEAERYVDAQAICNGWHTWLVDDQRFKRTNQDDESENCRIVRYQRGGTRAYISMVTVDGSDLVDTLAEDQTQPAKPPKRDPRTDPPLDPETEAHWQALGRR